MSFQQPPRLNDDLRMLRARFYLQQHTECNTELNQLSSDVSQEDRELWQRRVQLETNLFAVVQNQFPPTQNPTTDSAFQEHVMNLYAHFVYSPQNDLKVKVLEQLEAYMYQPELYNNIFLHLYGALMLWKSNKIPLARDLLTRTSAPSGTTPGGSEQAEFLLEKLYIMIQICLSKNVPLSDIQQILDEMTKIDNDDILVQLAKMDVLVQTPRPKPDHDEESELMQLVNELQSRYGPSLRAMVVQSSELIRQDNYRGAYEVLKKAKEWCVAQKLPFSAEVQINSIICLHYRSFSNLSTQQQLAPSYQQQQQQVDGMISTLEQELKQVYPNHPYFSQREEIMAKVQEALQQANIPTVQ